MTNLKTKEIGDNSMSLKHSESKQMYSRSCAALNLSWVMLNCVNLNSSVDRISNKLVCEELILYNKKARRMLIYNAYINTTNVLNDSIKNEWDPKTIRCIDNGTLGLPVERISHGDGRAIVPRRLIGYCSLIRRKCGGNSLREVLRFYSSRCDVRLHNGLEELKELQELAKLNKVKVFHLMLNYDLHALAYQIIKSKKGAMTKGIDEETLDGMSKKSILQTISKLKDHSFEFRPSRRAYIEKTNGESRPLGIPSPRDKIVQKVMAIILESIWEPQFSPRSHGFRPNKSPHSALKYVASWSGIDWLIEGDISKYFDTIDHYILESYLKEKIEDKQFLDLYWKAVRAGYIEIKQNKKTETMIGTPQGNIVSVILSNIYLHKLDKLMEQKEEESKLTGKTSVPNKEYLHLHSKIHHLYRMREKGRLLTSEEQKNLNEWKKARAKTPSKKKAKGYRIYYVRYADDFLIGLTGSLKLAKELKEELQTFLTEELKLSLNVDKTKITNSKTEKALFLGAHISRPYSRSLDTKRIRKTTVQRGVINTRIAAVRLNLNIPIEKLVKKLENQGFCKIKDYNQGQIKPMGKTAWINLPLQDIVLRYNTVILGIRNYYSFAKNHARMQFIQYILIHSCAKLIARKLKMKSRAKVFKKYGHKITIKYGEKGEKKAELKFKKSHKIKKVFNSNPTEPLGSVYYAIRSKSMLEKICMICKSQDQIEMHHIRHLKGKPKGFSESMKAINRKQIPVCKECHDKIHYGSYDGINLRKV